MIHEADAYSRLGRFARAERHYAEALGEAGVLEDEIRVYVLVRLGEIALLGNRLEEAERRLLEALEGQPANVRAHSLLAETHVRRDDFPAAASQLRLIGQSAEAAQLESFEKRTPYLVRGQVHETRVLLEQVDPLPVIQARVNGGPVINLLIDTGGAELILDPDLADELGLERFGSQTGSFAGGKTAPFHYAAVDSVEIGDFMIENVPVHLLPTVRFSGILGHEPIEAILGTVLRYHFLGA